MKKIIKKLLILAKYFLWYSSFERMLFDSKSKKEGEIKLFEKKFYFHHGLAFYDTHRELFKNNIYEFKTNKISPVIIDCGANMGLSVLYFSRLYPNAKILAFEPDETVLPFLERNIQSQNIQNVELFRKAVWTKEVELSFYTDNGLGGRVGIEYNNQTPTKIKSVRLRDFLDQPIDMLKIDIEGAEYDVIKDCEDMLFNVQYIFLEYHSFFNEEQHLEDVLSVLKRQGFRYHLRESFSRSKPFIHNGLVNEKFDMAINVFAYKN